MNILITLSSTRWLCDVCARIFFSMLCSVCFFISIFFCSLFACYCCQWYVCWFCRIFFWFVRRFWWKIENMLRSYISSFSKYSTHIMNTVFFSIARSFVRSFARSRQSFDVCSLCIVAWLKLKLKGCISILCMYSWFYIRYESTVFFFLPFILAHLRSRYHLQLIFLVLSAVRNRMYQQF